MPNEDPSKQNVRNHEDIIIIAGDHIQFKIPVIFIPYHNKSTEWKPAGSEIMAGHTRFLSRTFIPGWNKSSDTIGIGYRITYLYNNFIQSDRDSCILLAWRNGICRLLKDSGCPYDIILQRGLLQPYRQGMR
jgi:hypothetical protein